MHRLAFVPAALLLASCAGPASSDTEPTATPSAMPAIAEPTAAETANSQRSPMPTESPEALTTEPTQAPTPDTSPPPADAPKTLDTTATVHNLSTIDPAIAEAHGFLPTAYYPLIANPDLYCSVADTSVCGTSQELQAAFLEDFDQWAAEEGL